MARSLAFGLVALGVLAFPCAPSPPQTQLPAPDYACYVNAVEPELLARCAYAACHGKPERPLRLYAPAGNRLRPNLPPNALADEEQRANYDRARAFAAPTSAPLPDLLRKPLQLSAGGAGHGGVDRFGANVYASKEDPGWKLLDAWVNGTLTNCPPGFGFDGGSMPASCTQGVYSYQANIAPIVNPARCSDALCHTAQNVATGDAGCFLPDTCEEVLDAGCGGRHSVVPCAARLSKLYLYTGVLPYKAHQGKLSSANRQAIGDWIDAGAPCD